VDKLGTLPGGLPIIDGRRIYTICPRGHVDEEKPPGFGLNVQQAGENVFYKLCRICYHEFFVASFPGKQLPAGTSFEEAQIEAATWKLQTAAELERLAGAGGGNDGGPKL
jgi:hypothetical protein